MLTYQIRNRIFKHVSGPEQLVFPNHCSVSFHFEPSQSFGTLNRGRSPAKGKAAVVIFDNNRGRHHVESNEPLNPLSVLIEEYIGTTERTDAWDRKVQLAGSMLKIEQDFDTLANMDDFITGLYFTLPPLLNVHFSDPPVIARVDGQIGETNFRWELVDWTMHFQSVTIERQEAAFVSAWNRVPVVSGLRRRRLLAAAHYFHLAVKLDRSAHSVGEFMGETLLNLSKVLEVLFPPTSEDGTITTARMGLKALGYNDEQIEQKFIPSIALRNALDVGHSSLFLLTKKQLRVIHAYTEVAEQCFRELLDKVFTATVNGTWEVQEYSDGQPSTKVQEIIRRMSKHYEK
jgi:hypothetical protein